MHIGINTSLSRPVLSAGMPAPAPPEFALSIDPSGYVVGTNAGDTIDLTVISPAEYVTGSPYQVDISGISSGPVGVFSPAITGVRTIGNALTAPAPLFLFNGPTTPVLGYQWQRNTGSGFADITGTTGATLAAGQNDTPGDVRRKVTVTDANGTTEMVTAPATVSDGVVMRSLSFVSGEPPYLDAGASSVITPGYTFGAAAEDKNAIVLTPYYDAQLGDWSGTVAGAPTVQRAAFLSAANGFSIQEAVVNAASGPIDMTCSKVLDNVAVLAYASPDYRYDSHDTERRASGGTMTLTVDVPEGGAVIIFAYAQNIGPTGIAIVSGADPDTTAPFDIRTGEYLVWGSRANLAANPAYDVTFNAANTNGFIGCAIALAPK